MAEFIQKPVVSVTATLILNEVELRALDALAGYDVDRFLESFYSNMGRSYLQPFEPGLRTLFRSVRESVPPILERAKAARAAFNAEAQA